ncbi:Alpha/Beta hydrolase protein [Triangularia verruculosa]|uniref:Protein phosphatase methylesterase 1 n=1 Tax=Triangularia verruculosa TaxID=2587418 RepID=A0AAN6X932_9PEZI|nr:Alpha/Beta hydrolase protein [Triangularia verruculosa]
MSELQKKWAKARLSNSMQAHAYTPTQAMGTTAIPVPGTALPPPVSLPEFNELDEEDEDQFGSLSSIPNHPQDDDSSSASSVSSTGTVIPSPGRALFARPQGFPNRSLDPIPWTTYFERELFLPSSDGSITYHVYLTSPAPPASSGTTSSPAPGTTTKPSTGGPLFVTHHGAGSSALSFAVLGAEIRKRLPSAGILSLDARGHGLTTLSTPSEPIDLSLPTLSQDLCNAILLTAKAMSWPEIPPLILVGHSLGGAVVTELAYQPLLPPSASLLGYAVLDVVEGSALDALQSMQTYLSTRPQGFNTLKEGIEWHVRSRTIRNSVSARVSVPALLVDTTATTTTTTVTTVTTTTTVTTVTEQPPSPQPKTSKPWRWRTDLSSTQPFWQGWFVGLSKKFLGQGAKGPGRGAGKMLLLAGTDRLDTELTIGQMQGKYALQVFPEAGHFVHEDLPEKTAVALVDFYRRNDRSALVLPPKVSELLAQGRRV